MSDEQTGRPAPDNSWISMEELPRRTGPRAFLRGRFRADPSVAAGVEDPSGVRRLRDAANEADSGPRAAELHQAADEAEAAHTDEAAVDALLEAYRLEHPLQRPLVEADRWFAQFVAARVRAAFHVPQIARASTGWGVFCAACSAEVGDYVYPCRLPDTTGWWSEFPRRIGQPVADSERDTRLRAEGWQRIDSAVAIIRANGQYGLPANDLFSTVAAVLATLTGQPTDEAMDQLGYAEAAGSAVPAATPEQGAARLVSAISAMISGSYSPTLDAEAHMWRRHQKVANEAGEVLDAIEGALGENPRKGVTKTWADVDKELLDTATAALGAYEHNHGNDRSSVGALFAHITGVHDRLAAAVGPVATPTEPQTTDPQTAAMIADPAGYFDQVRRSNRRGAVANPTEPSTDDGHHQRHDAAEQPPTCEYGYSHPHAQNACPGWLAEQDGQR